MTDNFVKVANKNDIKPGTIKILMAQGIRVAICNVEGTYHAIADLCTHDNASLQEGELVGNQVECPRHGARFDVTTGKAMCLPAVTPVATYALELRGEDIWLNTALNATNCQIDKVK